MIDGAYTTMLDVTTGDRRVGRRSTEKGMTLSLRARTLDSSGNIMRTGEDKVGADSG